MTAAAAATASLITSHDTGIPVVYAPSSGWAGNQQTESSNGGSGSDSGAKQIFGSEDGLVVDDVPQVVPTTQTALYISDTGRQYQWFAGAWH